MKKENKKKLNEEELEQATGGNQQTIIPILIGDETIDGIIKKAKVEAIPDIVISYPSKENKLHIDPAKIDVIPR